MSESTLTSPNIVSREAVLGTFWNYAAFTSGKLLNFITTIILARLLIPEQFGVVGYCTAAIQYLDILNSAGIDTALIARKDKVKEASNAAFVINILMGVISFGLAWIAAPAIAAYFKSTEVTDLFRVLAIVLPITGLGMVPDTLLQRNLRFRDRLIPLVLRNVTKGLTSIILALLGWGPWCLIWGQIAGEVVGGAGAWIMAKWKPSWEFDRTATREILGYGFHIIFVGFAGALISNVDYIIVGRMLGAAALGFYTMAYRIPELTIRSLNDVAAKVLLPLFSRTQTDLKALRSFYFGYIQYVSVFTFSFGIGLALVSNLFVRNFLSSQWEASILPMAFISTALTIASIGYVPGILYKSINRPEILSYVAMAKVPVIIALLVVCARWGINGVAIGQVIFAIFMVILDSVIVSRVVHFNLREMVDALSPAVLSTLAMAAVVGLLQMVIPSHGLVAFALNALAGAAAFIGVLRLTHREMVTQIVATLRKGFAK